VPARVWIVDLVVLGAVLGPNVGTRGTGWSRALRPLVPAALPVPLYVKSPQTPGNGLTLEGVLASLGVAYAWSWSVVIAVRLLFVYRTTHWSPHGTGSWLMPGRATANGLIDGIVLTAIAMPLARTSCFVVALRAGSSSAGQLRVADRVPV
jgi:hypothetical protein